jgi:catechol 2,3-dioxygenase
MSLARAVARLLDHGGTIDDARDHGGTLSIYIHDPGGNGIELYYDRPPIRWFNSTGELVIKSDPFDVSKWLKDVWAGVAEVAREKAHFRSLEGTV